MFISASRYRKQRELLNWSNAPLLFADKAEENIMKVLFKKGLTAACIDNRLQKSKPERKLFQDFRQSYIVSRSTDSFPYARAVNILTIASIWEENMLGYLSEDR